MDVSSAFIFFFQAEDGIRDRNVTGVQTCALPILLNQIQPHQAFISAGKNNSYGHPNEEVLKRLEEMNIHTFTTAEQGAIMVKYYKIPFVKHWFIKTYTVYKN